MSQTRSQFSRDTAVLCMRDSWVMTEIIYTCESAGLYWDFRAWLHSVPTSSLSASVIGGTLLFRMLLSTLLHYLRWLSVEDKSVHCFWRAAFVPDFKSFMLAPVSQSRRFMPDGHSCWVSIWGKDFTHMTDAHALTGSETTCTLPGNYSRPSYCSACCHSNHLSSP